MVLQPEEPKISLSGINHFARSASEFESSEGVALFPELHIISTITREVEPEGDGDEDPTGNSSCAWNCCLPSPSVMVLEIFPWQRDVHFSFDGECSRGRERCGCSANRNVPGKGSLPRLSPSCNYPLSVAGGFGFLLVWF